MLGNTSIRNAEGRPFNASSTAPNLAQKVHATGILLVPAIAVLIAGWQMLSIGISLWQLVLMLSMWAMTILGITAGFHRLLAHRAYRAHTSVKIALSVLGCMALQGPPLYWVSNHRCHHMFSDQDGDPHSPHWQNETRLSGFWGFCHAHFGWTLSHPLLNSTHFCKDLYQERWILWVNRHYLKWATLGVVFTGLVGLLMESTMTGFWQGILWGSGVRLFFTYHATNAINSIAHLYGYRNYDTPDHSRNNAILAILTLGEGWHNNHHAFQFSGIFGHKWWEVDIAGIVLRILRRFGLVTDLRTASTKLQERREARKSSQK